VSHPVVRIVGLLLVLAGTPLVRLLSCFSIGAALVLSGALELIRAWALLPDPPEIPTRDLRWTVPRYPR
jgi:hypothetical protein